ncbi:MAG: hypothetical protein IKY87_05550 [Paludibacteraceae bacterium]|nr:hypothetical protein [Paludibacteraceae bacterium]
MKYLYLIPLLLLLFSCKTQSPVITAEQHDSTRVSLRNDSTHIYERDSIAMSYRPQVTPPRLPDSPPIANMPISNCPVPQLPPRVDTLVIEKWRIRYRDKVQLQVDTIYQDVVRNIEHPPERYVPKFHKWCTGLFWTIVVIFILYVAFRIAIRVYARK